MLNHRIQQQIVVDQAQCQPMHSVRGQPQIADRRPAPASIPAVDRDRQPTIGAQRHQIRPGIPIHQSDRHGDRRAAHRQRLVRQRSQRQHPPIFQPFRGCRPTAPLPTSASAAPSPTTASPAVAPNPRSPRTKPF